MLALDFSSVRATAALTQPHLAGTSLCAFGFTNVTRLDVGLISTVSSRSGPLICKPRKGQSATFSDSASASSVLEGYIGESDLARQLHRSLRTLRCLAASLSGPPRIKIGRSVYCKVESVRAWLAQQEKKSAESARSAGGSLRRDLRLSWHGIARDDGLPGKPQVCRFDGSTGFMWCFPACPKPGRHSFRRIRVQDFADAL